MFADVAVWRLRRRLKRAATLHAKGVMADVEYGLVCLDIVARLDPDQGQLLPGQFIPDVPYGFGPRAWKVLRREELTEVQALDVYGDFREAGHWAKHYLRKGGDGPSDHPTDYFWSSEAADALVRARLRMHLPGRLLVWADQAAENVQRILPNVSPFTGRMLERAAIFVVSFLLGLVVGLWRQ